MDQIMNYVKPELLVLAVVLYFVGVGMKKTEAIADKYIPISLGGLGILLCGIWVVATCPLSGMQEKQMKVANHRIEDLEKKGEYRPTSTR